MLTTRGRMSFLMEFGMFCKPSTSSNLSGTTHRRGTLESCTAVHESGDLPPHALRSPDFRYLEKAEIVRLPVRLRIRALLFLRRAGRLSPQQRKVPQAPGVHAARAARRMAQIRGEPRMDGQTASQGVQAVGHLR